jgi:hypothetical protein
VEDGKYVDDADREAMVQKIRLILRAAVIKGELSGVGHMRTWYRRSHRVICGNFERKSDETWGSDAADVNV